MAAGPALGAEARAFAIAPPAGPPAGAGPPRAGHALGQLAAGAGGAAPPSAAAPLGAAGLLALAAGGLAAGRRAGRGRGRGAGRRRQAAAGATAPAGGFVVDEDEEEEPPPPPPFDPATQVGALEPLGFFDPLGFCPPGDEGKFRGLRAAELKHGRVAMLAAVGAVAQHYVRFPVLGMKDSPSGLLAAYEVPSAFGFTLLVFTCMLVELLVWKEDPRKEPGNFGDPFGLNMYDKDMRNRELNNGRFAMFAAIGIIAAELLTGKDAAQQLGL